MIHSGGLTAHAMHPDMKCHTGIFMSIGKAPTYTSSCKQKFNMKSSMEAELVPIDDAIAQILWTRHFLAAQGITEPVTTIYNDNKNTILLSENSSKHTKHLDVQYFFVTDQINCREVKMANCPTENMLADFFTKPHQGQRSEECAHIYLICLQMRRSPEHTRVC